MNIVLVLPRTFINPYEPEHFPVGMAYVSSALKAKGHAVEIVNMNFMEGTVEEELRRLLSRFPAHIVATGGLVTHYHLVKEVMDESKKIAPDAHTVIGGGLVTCAPSVVMTGIANADIGVVGEGEATMAEVCEALGGNAPLGNVDGIVYRSADGSLVQTAHRREIEDLDALAWPDYEGFQFAKMLEIAPKRYLTLSTGRSCAYKCTFCFHTSGRRYRQRSLDSFFQELDWVVDKYGIDNIYITDELFASDKKRLNEFCARIKPYNILWAVQLRVDVIDATLLELLKDSGCIILSLGLESADDRILKSMRKKTTIAQIENALECCSQVGIRAHGGFIFGDVEEDEQSVATTLDWWRSHRHFNVSLSMIQVYPGTQLYRHALEKGIVTDELKFIEDGCPYINVSKLSDKAYKDLSLHIEELQAAPSGTLSHVKAAICDPKQRLADISGTCQACGFEMTLNGVHVAKISSYRCSSCGAPFTLSPVVMFSDRIMENITMLLASHSIVFVQATRILHDLFTHIPGLRDSGCCVADVRALKQGFNHPFGEVYSLESIPEKYDCAIICDYVFDMYYKNMMKAMHPKMTKLLGMWELIHPIDS